MRTHHIDIGHAAQSLLAEDYTGSDLGAVRRLLRIWRSRPETATMGTLHRVVDGEICSPMRTVRAPSLADRVDCRTGVEL